MSESPEVQRYPYVQGLNDAVRKTAALAGIPLELVAPDLAAEDAALAELDPAWSLGRGSAGEGA